MVGRQLWDRLLMFAQLENEKDCSGVFKSLKDEERMPRESSIFCGSWLSAAL